MRCITCQARETDDGQVFHEPSCTVRVLSSGHHPAVELDVEGPVYQRDDDGVLRLIDGADLHPRRPFWLIPSEADHEQGDEPDDQLAEATARFMRMASETAENVGAAIREFGHAAAEIAAQFGQATSLAWPGNEQGDEPVDICPACAEDRHQECYGSFGINDTTIADCDCEAGPGCEAAVKAGCRAETAGAAERIGDPLDGWVDLGYVEESGAAALRAEEDARRAPVHIHRVWTDAKSSRPCPCPLAGDHNPSAWRSPQALAEVGLPVGPGRLTGFTLCQSCGAFEHAHGRCPY